MSTKPEKNEKTESEHKSFGGDFTEEVRNFKSTLIEPPFGNPMKMSTPHDDVEKATQEYLANKAHIDYLAGKTELGYDHGKPKSYFPHRS